MSSKRPKRVSKKNKSGWRKSSINDVEEYLEEQRQEERIGLTSDKRDEDLFVIDRTPLRKTQLSLTEKQKRKLNAKKPLRSLQSLENTSKVQDPIVKRNHVKQKKNGRLIEEEVRNPHKPRHFLANKDRELYQEKMRKRNPEQSFDKDIWVDEDFRDQVPGLKDEKGWISHRLSLHVVNNIGKKVIKTPDALRHRTTKAKNFEVPHEGMSYNPSIEAHQDLIQKVVEKEKEFIKIETHLKRVTTDMFSKVTPEERDLLRIKEMSSGLENEGEENQLADISNLGNINCPVENKKKSTQTRNKQQRHKELLKRHEERKALKKQLADITRIKSLKAEVVAEELKTDDKKKRRKKEAFQKKFDTKRLSRIKYVDPDIQVNMAEDIAGNLRNVKAESNLLIDRFKSFQKRNILPASVASGKQKKRKIKRFTRSSHKET